MNGLRNANLKGELTGAISSSYQMIPFIIANGVIAFAPLGDKYLPVGVMSAFAGAIILSVLHPVLGGAPGLISGPHSVASIVIGAMFAQLTVHNHDFMASLDPVSGVMAITLLAVTLAGVFQFLFGFFRFGTLIKFIPYPILAGYINSSVVLIVLGQTRSFLSLKPQDSLSDWLIHMESLHWADFAVVAATVLAIAGANIFKSRLPATLVGFFAGTAAYHTFAAMGATFGSATLMEVSFSEAAKAYSFDFFGGFAAQEDFDVVITIVLASVTIAMLSSVESLLSLLSIGYTTEIPLDSNRELKTYGATNVLSGLSGGLAGGSYFSTSLINYTSGGKGALSSIFTGLILLSGLIVFSGALELIPKTVIAVNVIYVAFKIFDKWTLSLIGKAFRKEILNKREAVNNLALIFAVVIVTVVFNLVAAVASGLFLSAIIFMAKMSRSPIRRVYHGDSVRSRKRRSGHVISLLQGLGRKIVIFELEGAIFFGSADFVALEVEKTVKKGSLAVIIDLKRVKEIDSTGLKILDQSHTTLKKNHKQLFISGVNEKSSLGRFFKDMGVIDSIGPENFFDDTDMALERAENLALTVHIESKFLDFVNERVSVVALRDHYTEEDVEDLLAWWNEQAGKGIRYFLVNLESLTAVEPWTQLFICRAYSFAQKTKAGLGLCPVDASGPMREGLDRLGIITLLGEENVFPSVEAAKMDNQRLVDLFEEEMFSEYFPDNVIPLEKSGLFRDFPPEEINVFKNFLKMQRFAKGSVILQSGEKADNMYFIISGFATIYIKAPETGAVRRLETCGPGTVVGEGMIYSKSRTANARADTDLVCYSLTLGNFRKICDQFPPLGLKFYHNIGLELTERLRTANIMVSQIEL
ncbi:MAG: SLC26A/SulP transporter family protein [Nitrospinae bacterium]|nr:SLC26A/SulP transporter family protein [Nitrospinota bacterium]